MTRRARGLASQPIVIWYIFVYLAIVSALLYASRTWLSYKGMTADIETWGVFFSAFGTLYAIIIGFVLLESLNRYSQLAQTIDEEVNAVQDVRDFLEYLDNGQEHTIIDIEECLLSYVDDVIHREWQAMADPNMVCDEDTSDKLYGVIKSTNNIKVTNPSDGVALTAIVGHIATITTVRTRRICIAENRLPPLLQVLLQFMSAVLVLGVIFLAVQSAWAHYFMATTLTVSVFLAYQVLDDLAHPFGGAWSLDKGRFVKLAAKLKEKLEEHRSLPPRPITPPVTTDVTGRAPANSTL